MNAQNRKADSLLNLIKNAKEEDKAALYNQVAAQYRQSDPQKNIDYATKALDFAQKTGNESEEGIAYSNLGFGWFIKGDYSKASGLIGRTIELGKKLGNKKLLGACYNNLGLLDQNQGNLKKALDNFKIALQNREAVLDTNGMASTNNNLGEVYRLCNRNKEALVHFHRAEELYKKTNNKNGLGSVNSNIGAVYFQMEDFGSAIFYFEQGAKLRRETHNKRGLAIVLGNLAEVFMHSNDNERALPYIKEAIGIAEKIGDPLIYIAELITLSKVYANTDSLNAAKKTINIALDSAKKLGLKLQIQEAELYYAEILHKAGDDAGAYKYALKSRELHDSIFNNESGQKVASLQSEMDKEKREAEIKLQEESEKRQRSLLLLGMIFLLIAAAFIFNQYRSTNRANKKLGEQNKIIELKNKEITDSIDYAKKIQNAILPLTRDLKKVFPSGFGLYQPKDIVSGDFYWFVEHQDKFLIAAADCTGHGVPGAFMSMLGTDKLTHAVKDKNIIKPSEILAELNRSVKQTLKQKEVDSELRDGMDIALCSFDFTTNILEFSGANRPLYHIRDGLLNELKPTKSAIGGLTSDDQEYINHRLKIKTGDSFFIFTDGFPDQFGGERGKKFSSKRFKKTLISIQEMDMQKQEKALVEIMKDWTTYNGSQYEQVDDILVIGISI